MYKGKRYRKIPYADMAAMCDVAFILLTFFILAAKPKGLNPLGIGLPFSHNSTISDPEEQEGTLFIGKGKIMYSVADTNVRKEVLTQMGNKYHIKFSLQEMARFKAIKFIGCPMSSLKSYIDNYPKDQSVFDKPGIPTDSTKHELADWIDESRKAFKTLYYKNLDITIEADARTNYPQINYAFSVLGSLHIYKFNLQTNKGYFRK